MDRNDYLKLAGVVAGGILILGIAAMLLFGGGGEPDRDGVFVNGTNRTPADAPEQTTVVIDEGQFGEEMSMIGVYAGHLFTRQYPAPVNGSAVIEIGPNLVPSDGVAEVFINGRIDESGESPVFIAEVYVDDDFRNDVGTVNVAWGPRFTDNFRSYDFNEYATDNGGAVYRDTLRDTNTSRFQVRGGAAAGEANVAVGNFSRADVAEQRVDGLTFVTAR